MANYYHYYKIIYISEFNKYYNHHNSELKPTIYKKYNELDKIQRLVTSFNLFLNIGRIIKLILIAKFMLDF